MYYRTVPTNPGPYWCRYRAFDGNAGHVNAIIFLAGQAPLLQVVGLQVVDEHFLAAGRFIRQVELKDVVFVAPITPPSDPPGDPQ